MFVDKKNLFTLALNIDGVIETQNLITMIWIGGISLEILLHLNYCGKSFILLELYHNEPKEV